MRVNHALIFWCKAKVVRTPWRTRLTSDLTQSVSVIINRLIRMRIDDKIMHADFSINAINCGSWPHFSTTNVLHQPIFFSNCTRQVPYTHTRLWMSNLSLSVYMWKIQWARWMSKRLQRHACQDGTLLQKAESVEEAFCGFLLETDEGQRIRKESCVDMVKKFWVDVPQVRETNGVRRLCTTVSV